MGAGQGSGKLFRVRREWAGWVKPGAVASVARGTAGRAGSRRRIGMRRGVVTLEGVDSRTTSGRIPACPHSNATSLSATTSAPPMRRGLPARAMGKANCTPAAATGREAGLGRQGADQQVRLPGPVRARAHGGGLSRGRLVRQCEAGGCGGDCGRAPGGRAAGGAAAHRRGVPEHEELPAQELRVFGVGFGIHRQGRCGILTFSP